MKAKTIIILVATLLIGMVVGSLGTGYLVRKKVRNMSRRFRSPERFKHHFIERLNISEDQQVEIDPIIETYSKKRLKLRKQHFQSLIETEKSFHKALAPHLDEDQMEFLHRRLERMKRRSWRRRGRGRRGRGRDRDRERHKPPPPEQHE